MPFAEACFWLWKKASPSCVKHTEKCYTGKSVALALLKLALPFCLAPRDLKKEKYFLNCSWPIIHRRKNNAGEPGNLGAASFHF